MNNTIKRGATGDLVKTAQYLLGYSEMNNANGQYNDLFTSFVKKWQSDNGLVADGIIGPASWTKIADNAPTCSTAKNKRSAATCALQLELGKITVDGDFGKNTKAAVVAFQVASGLDADGICGPKTWNALLASKASSAEVVAPIAATTGVKPTFKQPIDYKQYDSRWAKVVFTSCGNKSQTIKNSGCGPTAAADVVATLKDKSVTPKTLADLAVRYGFRTKNSGTAWSFFAWLADRYGFSDMIETTSLATMKAALARGGYVVCSMGPGFFTRGGHYICAWKYDDTTIYVNDPASSSRKKQNLKDFQKQRKRFFCFIP